MEWFQLNVLSISCNALVSDTIESETLSERYLLQFCRLYLHWSICYIYLNLIILLGSWNKKQQPKVAYEILVKMSKIEFNKNIPWPSTLRQMSCDHNDELSFQQLDHWTTLELPLLLEALYFIVYLEEDTKNLFSHSLHHICAIFKCQWIENTNE